MSSVVSVIELARARRAEVQRRGRRRSVLLAGAVLVVWAVAVIATGQLDRVSDNAAAALTMVFGSFVAGSTPQGGGAVAFPVFTKLLGVSTTDARTFSLAIQAVGMGTASVVIALTGRTVDRGALRLTIPSAVAGFLLGSMVFSIVAPPSTYLKVLFTLVVVAAGAATWLSRRRALVEHLQFAPLDNNTVRMWLAVAAAAGGVASSLFGSGADVAVYLLLTIVLGVRPSVGVATSVVTMAVVSVIGLVSALATGQLTPVDVAAGTDVFGMWLAAVPVVVVGAPVGSWFANRVSPAGLARFIAGLAAVELISTVIFLQELRTDTTLAIVAVFGLVLTVAGIHRIMTVRDHIATGRSVTAASIRRLDMELAAAR